MSTSSTPSFENDLAVATAKPRARRPSLWKVVVLNDDFTPMDFVVVMLIEVFSMERKRAERVMLDIHEKGRAIAGTYPKDVADLKVQVVEAAAKVFNHPLLLELEKVEGSDEG